MFADHLEVRVHGTRSLNLALAEVAHEAREQNSGVGGPNRKISYRPLEAQMI